MSAATHHLLADGVLILHVAFVAFVVLGLPVILLGGRLGWPWVRDLRFRICHLAAISLVVIQALLGMVCPLTTLEMHLRGKAGDETYEGTFIAHWLHHLLFFNAPLWVFTACYLLFGLAVIASWWWVKPSKRPR